MPNDSALQNIARELSEKHEKEGLFEIRIEGWTTLHPRIADYRALRAAYSDPNIHVGYVMGLVFMGRAQKDAFRQPTQVEPDTAVLMAEKNGSRKLVRVLETATDLKIERDEIAPDKELGPRLLGHKVGDEITVPALGFEPTVYVIVEIRDEFLHSHFR